MAGPLTGLRIIEFAGIGPAPFCGMMLADHGADVIRIDRIGAALIPNDPLGRSKKSLAINMKSEEGLGLARDLVASSDGLIEGFRPGVMERMGLGPEVLMKDHPSLVYGRMTGWGQTGPYAQAAGHDINYIALSGILDTCGRAGEKPTPPVNYLGDFGGGAMMLAFSMMAALLNVARGGKGDVIDCAMTDGSAVLSALTWGIKNIGMWKDERGVNLIDTGAHFYDTYETKDGKFISIGAIEPQFYTILREKIGLAEDATFDAQNDQAKWPNLKEKLAAVFLTKTRDEWCSVLEHTDACFAPVLSMDEAATHPHNVARDTFTKVGEHTQPAPAPRYENAVLDLPAPAPVAGADTDAILELIGRDKGDVRSLRDKGVVG